MDECLFEEQIGGYEDHCAFAFAVTIIILGLVVYPFALELSLTK